jgi:hypothetical protein
MDARTVSSTSLHSRKRSVLNVTQPSMGTRPVATSLYSRNRNSAVFVLDYPTLPMEGVALICSTGVDGNVARIDFNDG